MKNYNVKGLVGRVSIDTDCFIKALNDKKDNPVKISEIDFVPLHKR